MKLTRQLFGEFDGQPVHLYTLENSQSIKLSVTDYGCIVTELWAPDRDGYLADVVLGYEKLDAYLAGRPLFGAIAGRFANRIHDGKFAIDGNEYTLATNEPLTKQHLHGGVRGFNKYVWDVTVKQSDEQIMLEFARISPDGEEGYPGTLSVVHTVGLDEQGQVHFNFRAETDKPTVINLINHSFYNLAGHGAGRVCDQVLQLDAELVTPVGENMIPTGELRQVADMGHDFREPVVIGERMEDVREGAFDTNFVLKQTPVAGKDDNGLHKAGELFDPASGRVMTVETTQPAIQFYNGFKLSSKPWLGKGGVKYEAFGGLCLETQHFPDSPNQPHFPSTVLRPGEVFEQRTIHRFSVR